MQTPDPVTIGLCYLFVGCVIWAFAFGTDTWQRAIDRRALGAVIAASAFVIMCWLPLMLLFVWAVLAGGQAVERARRRAF